MSKGNWDVETKLENNLLNKKQIYK